MIKLTALLYDAPIWINTRLVTSLEKHTAGGTVIRFDQDNEVYVQESLETIGDKWPALPIG